VVRSRRRHTRLVSDWSSDVCSSDLLAYAARRIHAVAVARLLLESLAIELTDAPREQRAVADRVDAARGIGERIQQVGVARAARGSEERRVGKEGGERWAETCGEDNK